MYQFHIVLFIFIFLCLGTASVVLVLGCIGNLNTAQNLLPCQHGVYSGLVFKSDA